MGTVSENRKTYQVSLFFIIIISVIMVIAAETISALLLKDFLSAYMRTITEIIIGESEIIAVLNLLFLFRIYKMALPSSSKGDG